MAAPRTFATWRDSRIPSPTHTRHGWADDSIWTNCDRNLRRVLLSSVPFFKARDVKLCICTGRCGLNVDTNIRHANADGKPHMYRVYCPRGASLSPVTTGTDKRAYVGPPPRANLGDRYHTPPPRISASASSKCARSTLTPPQQVFASQPPPTAPQDTRCGNKAFEHQVQIIIVLQQVVNDLFQPLVSCGGVVSPEAQDLLLGSSEFVIRQALLDKNLAYARTVPEL